MEVLKYPLTSDKVATIWSVEAGVVFYGTKQPAKVSLHIPSSQDRFSIIDESFISSGFGLTTSTKDGNRQAVWSARNTSGRHQLFYRAVVRERQDPGEPLLLQDPSATSPSDSSPVEPAFDGAKLVAVQSLLEGVRQRSADSDTLVLGVLAEVFRQQPSDDLQLLLGVSNRRPSRSSASEEELKRVQLTGQILQLAGVQSRIVQGVKLERQVRNAQVRSWIEVLEGQRWIPYEPTVPQRGVPPEYLAWWRGDGVILQVKGVERQGVAISVDSREESLLSAALSQSREVNPLVAEFSLFSLPLHTQLVYRIMLLVPIGALIIVIIRNIVGIKTFGTFMPVLIAMAFRETQLVAGLALFIVIVAFGLVVRFYLEHLKLLLVPRLAAVLTAVIIIMAAASIIGHKLGFERGLSAALFPMVILTMTVERMSIVWDELGPAASIRQGLGTLFAASMVYFIITWRALEHLLFVFPELLLVIMAIILLLGRYTGYRLTELKRFRNIKAHA